MKKSLLTSLIASILYTSIASAALPEDFEGASPLSDWSLSGNPWNTTSDPTNASNTVFDTSDRSAGAHTLVSGVSLGISGEDTFSLSFDFYLQDATSADIGVTLTEVTNFDNITTSDFYGPTLRLLDDKIQIHDGAFTDSLQSIATQTWYTVVMSVDNTSDTWTGSILGGSFATPTALTIAGDESTFAYRNTKSSLNSFALRANGGNDTATGGALLDNISVIPEANTFALLSGIVAFGMIMIRRRRV